MSEQTGAVACPRGARWASGGGVVLKLRKNLNTCTGFFASCAGPPPRLGTYLQASTYIVLLCNMRDMMM